MSEFETEIGENDVARRAHEISESGNGSQSDEENWFQAERELREASTNGQTTKGSKSTRATTSAEAVPAAD